MKQKERMPKHRFSKQKDDSLLNFKKLADVSKGEEWIEQDRNCDTQNEHFEQTEQREGADGLLILDVRELSSCEVSGFFLISNCSDRLRRRKLGVDGSESDNDRWR